MPIRLAVTSAAARDLSWLDALAPDSLSELGLVQTDVTDAELDHVGRLEGLRVLLLGFAYTHITDIGLARLRPLHNLWALYLLRLI